MTVALSTLGHLKKGGLIVRHHNEVHDCIEKLSSLARRQGTYGKKIYL